MTITDKPIAASRILLLSGSRSDNVQLVHGLQQVLPDTHFIHVDSAAGLSPVLENGNCDVIVIEGRLGWAETPEVLARIRTQWPDCPAIVLVAPGEQPLVTQSGLEDYIPGSPLDSVRLAGSVRRLIVLRQRMQALMDAEARYHSLYDGVPVGLYRATPDGELVDANSALVQVLGYPDRSTLLGEGLGPLFVDPRVYAQWQESLRQSGAVLGFEALLRRHDGRIICMLGNASAVHDDDGSLLYYDGALEDITDRKRTEEELRLLQTIMVAVSEATDPQASIAIALKKVCDSTGWIVGQAWLPDSNGRQLECSPAWHGVGAGLEEFRAKSLEYVFAPGQGLPGSAWSLRQPVWVRDVTLSDNFPRAAIAVAAGIKAGMAIPVVAGDQVVAVLEFFVRELREEDSRLLLLVSSVASQLGSLMERRRSEERLIYLATHDALTGLPTRILFNDRLRQAMIEADRHERLVGVVFLDMDHFKNINDTLGHDAGDQLLKLIAGRLKTNVRAGDTVARLSGDEFSVVLADMAHVDDASRVAQNILDCFLEPFPIGEREYFITPSIGITLYPFDDNTIENLLKNADIAMYRAKECGRNTYQFYAAEMTDKARQRLSIETSLRRALEKNEFVLHYQPVVDCRAGSIVGIEALLRWQHPAMGMVPPMSFIPLAEETGLIEPIGEWVLHTACSQLDVWRQLGLPAVRLAVNLSGRQFNQKNLVQIIVAALQAGNTPPRELELELTESILMQNVEATMNVLHAISEMGVGLSVDDFGTGYSSLSYLKRFPIDTLKIDQSFVRDITTDADDAAISTAIIAMAHGLDIKVIAEGVETREQLDFLHSHNCDFMQGYYFSRPVSADQMTALLQPGDGLQITICR